MPTNSRVTARADAIFRADRREGYVRAVEGRNTRFIRVDGVDYLNFSGSSYLDLAGNDEMIAAAIASLQRYGFANDLGYETAGVPIIDVEKAAATYFGTEAALYFTSAYVASLAAVLHVADAESVLFLDETAHFSLQHAAKLADRPVVTFAHNDAEGLRLKVQSHLSAGQKPIVLTDGVSPTWGNLPPVERYAQLAEEYGGWVIVDDAHGAGILGKNGRGTVEHLRVDSDRVIFAAGLSKAFGTQGGILPGSSELVERIRDKNPVYNSVSLPSMPIASAAVKAFEIAGRGELRRQLWENAQHMKRSFAALGLSVSDTVVPIATFSTGDGALNRNIYEGLLKEGFWITLSNYVGAPSEKALRNAVYATHTTRQIDDLINCYRQYL